MNEIPKPGTTSGNIKSGVAKDSAIVSPVENDGENLSDAEASERIQALKSVPVFFDEQRNRWPWFLRGISILSIILSAGAILFVISLFALQILPRVSLPKEVQDREPGMLESAMTDHGHRQAEFVRRKEDRLTRQEKLRIAEARKQLDKRREARRIAERAVLKSGLTAPPSPVIAGFYVNWEQASNASMRRNIDAMTHFIPEWLHVKSAGWNYADPSPANLPFIDARTKQDRDEVTPFVHSHKIVIIALINNLTKKEGEEGEGQWDSQAVHEIVSNPKARANVIAQLRNWLQMAHLQGINIDFEQVQEGDKDNLVNFMKELYTDFHANNLLVTQDIELESTSVDVENLALWNDWIVPMFYDEHEVSSAAGPVAGIDWTRQHLTELLTLVDPGKIVMGVGNHAYDWQTGEKTADLTYQSAIVTCKESEPDSIIKFDPVSLNPMFEYTDVASGAKLGEHEVKHTVWMQDAVSVYNQLVIGKKNNIRGSALWFIGAEDPSLWSFFHKNIWNTDWSALVEKGGLNKIDYRKEGDPAGGQGEVTFEGDGELLQPLAKPSGGQRIVTLDKKTGLITSERYEIDPQTGNPLYPSAYVVRRFGGDKTNSKKQIILTFDDGPDETWTPKILDILKQNSVPAVFFVVGKEAESHPDLLLRIWNEGHEIGNHSWDHPDLFRLPPEIQKLELTSTERIIQSVTGHSTLLFRPPYGGDTEPRYAREVQPMEVASELNYITVGEKNDPQDWRLFDYKPGTEAQDYNKSRDYHDIIASVITNRDVGSIVLLHDAGGDRSRTVAALPEIITQLKAKGYTFITIAQLRGVPREKLMPLLTGNRGRALVGADRVVFEISYWAQITLATLFTLSLFLGVSRVFLFVVLALVQRIREQQRVFPVGFTPSVSVIIAAFNEEKVVASTVRSLLSGDYTNMEIIVVDDGSKDRTAAVVREEFGDEPRVRVFSKENGGKSTALNRGILEAHGEIIVSLDADTLFSPDTISRLTRHFADPKVAAVSGNVRVGNAHNILTRWQALEYITSQNFDRRAYDLLNCITVVPGAVGALRRSAILEVGSYTSDTLAEDTDLTWKLRRAGWRIVNDNSAMAYTEAPETLSSLSKQRYRWAFGTLQCLWKHRAAMGHHKAFGWLALPSLWLYQILFPAISPFMDIAMVFSICTRNWAMLLYYLYYVLLIELIAAAIALWLDKGDWKLLPWLITQRFVYRQLMYYVILKSIVSAIRGGAVGWNKLERTGTARIEGKPSG